MPKRKFAPGKKITRTAPKGPATQKIGDVKLTKRGPAKKDATPGAARRPKQAAKPGVRKLAQPIRRNSKRGR